MVVVFINQAHQDYGRTLNVADGRLNIFILIDASGSILENQFENAKRATANLIRKVCIDLQFIFVPFPFRAHNSHIHTIRHKLSLMSEQLFVNFCNKMLVHVSSEYNVKVS